MKHIPVLLEEVLAALKPKKGHVVVDCTVGLGGHSAELLERGVPVIGLDLGPANLKEAQGRFDKLLQVVVYLEGEREFVRLRLLKDHDNQALAALHLRLDPHSMRVPDSDLPPPSDRPDDPRRFKGWLCSIVRTTCVDWLRKERVKPTSLEKITDEGLEPEGEFLGTVFKQTSTELEELREKVLHVVNALPKIYQQIILLRHLRKMTYREMGDFLGLPVATIESRLYRARLMLKDKLMDLYC